MVRFIIQALGAALGFWFSSKLISGVHVRSVESLIAAGFILGVLNALVRPVLVLLTIPLSLLTLGLFLFVVNGLTVWMTAYFLKGVDVDGLWPAILASIVITLTGWAARAASGGV
jgi:putative membrane protein